MSSRGRASGPASLRCSIRSSLPRRSAPGTVPARRSYAPLRTSSSPRWTGGAGTLLTPSWALRTGPVPVSPPSSSPERLGSRSRRHSDRPQRVRSARLRGSLSPIAGEGEMGEAIVEGLVRSRRVLRKSRRNRSLIKRYWARGTVEERPRALLRERSKPELPGGRCSSIMRPHAKERRHDDLLGFPQ